MAQQVLVQLVDDLDGSTSSDVTTVQFGLDGVTYEIDLSDPNAEQLRKALAEYVDSARRTGGRVKRGVRARNASATNGEASRIREWARTNGIELAARGRIPTHVAESYRQAQDEPKPATRKRRSGAKKS
jgi:hypothetical protein